MHLTRSGKNHIHILDLKGLVNCKFETHWVLISYSYLGAFTFLCKKHPVTCEFLPDVRMHFALPKKNIWSFPISSKRVNSFRVLKKSTPLGGTRVALVNVIVSHDISCLSSLQCIFPIPIKASTI